MILIEGKPPEIPGLGSIVKLPGEPSNIHNFLAQIIPRDQEIHENYSQIFDQMETQWQQNQTSTLGYPIFEPVANAPVKAIPLQNIPNFHGMASKDPYAFYLSSMCCAKAMILAPIYRN